MNTRDDPLLPSRPVPAPTAPAISVIMPVYNAGMYLLPALQSILAQSFTNFEFLIFDDCSTDGSADLLKQCAENDPRIKLVLGHHAGLSHWLNRGVEIAAAPYIARMDSDDIALPQRLASQHAYLEHHPECVALGGQGTKIDARGNTLGPFVVPTAHDQIDERHLCGYGGQIMHPNALFRTTTLRQAGSYRPEFEPAEDLDLFLRLAEIGRLANLPEVTLHYRIHVKSVSHLRLKQQKERGIAAVADAHRRRGWAHASGQAGDSASAPTEADIARSWIRNAHRTGNFRAARKYARRYIWRTPLSMSSWQLFVGSMLEPFARPMRRLLKGRQPRPPNKNEVKTVTKS